MIGDEEEERVTGRQQREEGISAFGETECGRMGKPRRRPAPGRIWDGERGTRILPGALPRFTRKRGAGEARTRRLEAW